MSANAVVALADGLMDQSERSQWQSHLADCGLCRELVAVLVDEKAPAVALPTAGEMVGRYEILDRLGMGGFGVVFRARDTKLERDVALKLWRVDPLGSGGEESIDDLIEEARALAKLSHPNVMAVYDAGRAGERVFLSGELIKGASLYERSCVGERAKTEELATWMAQCAYGLTAAHDVGLIHRDVKPDNILIGDDGRARIVDFGLSTSGLAPNGATTIGDSLAGTPAYMSPEELLGEAATERSDQYSLCASFYEASHRQRLLLATDMSGLREAAKLAKVPVLDKKLPRRLRSVLQRGLQPDPSQRFPSMAALAAALRPKAASRIVPFAFGGAVAVAAGMAVMFSSEKAETTDCSVLAQPMKKVWNPERAAQIEKGFLEFGSKYSTEAFAGVQARLDRYSSNWQSMAVASCEATYHERRTSEAMFDREMLCLERRLGEVGTLLEYFAQPDTALLERAPRAMATLVSLDHCADRDAFSNLPPLPSDAEERAKLRELEATLAKAEGARFAGRYEEATRIAESGLVQATSLGYGPLEGEAAFELGYVWSYRSGVADAARLLEEAHHKALSVRDFRTSARAAVELVLVYGILSPERDYEKAAEWTKHADTAILAAGDDKLLRSNLESNLGDMAYNQGDLEEAVRHNENALSLRKALYGDNDRSVAQSLNNLAMVRQSLGKYSEAFELYREAREIFVASLGEHHPYVGSTATNLGSLLIEVNDPKGALEYFVVAYDIAVDAFGEDSLDAIQARFNIATARAELLELREALEMLIEIRSKLSADFAVEKETRARVANSLGVVNNQLGQQGEAETYFREAIELYLEVHTHGHTNILLARYNLAQAIAAQNRAKEALTLYESVLKGYERAVGPDHLMIATVLSTRAELYIDLKQMKLAEADLLRAQRIVDGSDMLPLRQAQLSFLWGKLMLLKGNLAEAVNRVKAAKALYESAGAKGEVGARDCETWLQAAEAGTLDKLK